MLQTFTFTGAGRQINAQASYFKYESGSAGGADESVSVRVDGQALGEYFPGDSVRLPVAGVLWEIVPSNPACSGRVRLGVGQVESSRLVGTVKVIDQAADKTIAGGQFLQSNTIAAAAGQGSVASLHPNGSSKKIVVRSLFLQSSVAGSILLGWGTGGGSLGLSAAGVQLKAKLLNAVGSDSRTAVANCAAVTPSVAEITGMTGIARFFVPANDTRQVRFDAPIVITGTNILVISAEQLNRDLSVVFDVEEQA